ncbi:glycosyltransferase family 10 domain-containing protein [Aminobacter sp. HY435]|uniref:glycosyltransferase family 10 domain-containing protein n=1 Tax=Aminobacter sp. HY435 TaxID=2970917 RepID=UPI0022B9B4D6|nr:glycosyltransferase family 10 [Aminobacter sp. HY435]
MMTTRNSADLETSNARLAIKVHCCHFWEGMTADVIMERWIAPWANVFGSSVTICDKLADADLVLIGPFAPKHENVPGTRMPMVPAGGYERVFITGENATPVMDVCEWALAFDFEPDIGNDHYMRYPIYAWSWGGHGDSILHALVAKAPETPAERAARRHFCAFIYSNKRAKLRRWLFRTLSLYRRVDAPGRVQNNCLPIGPTGKAKIDFLKERRFTIAFENSSAPGYTTEKIVDAMQAGSVPIYWGDPRVAEQFDERCYINWHAHEARICRVLALGNDKLARSRIVRKLATPLTLLSVVRRTIKADRDPAIYEAFFAQSPLTEHTRSYLDERRIADFWHQVLKSSETRARAKTAAGR